MNDEDDQQIPATDTGDEERGVGHDEERYEPAEPGEDQTADPAADPAEGDEPTREGGQAD